MPKLRVTFLFVAILVSSMVAAYLLAVPSASGSQGLDKGRGQGWQDRATDLFEIEGVVFTAVDEQNDRLVVGVTNRGLSVQVQARLRQLGIPLNAVDIVETKPIVFVTTLRDKVRPLQGGLQIAFQSNAFVYACTLGFNAVRSGIDGFLVNSHCTAKQGEVENTKHYQPTISLANLVGTEIADPSFIKGGTGGCPKGKKCRYSDSAYSRRESGVSADLGYLARTTGANNGSLDIAGSFTIVSEAASNAAVGETLNKVGRTTGWTQGLVTYSCANVAVQGTNIVMLCQDIVSAGVGGGDSGSPVFRILDGTNVQLYGILWGGSSDGSLFVYSPIANIQRELGELITCADGSC